MFCLPCEGPLAAFDYHQNYVICYNEARNAIVRAEIGGGNLNTFYLPNAYCEKFYCWIKLCYVSGSLLMGLIKKHKDKSFHLVSMRLDHHNYWCTIMHHVSTGVYSNGLLVQFHRSMSQFVFCISNKKSNLKRSRSSPATNDREAFLRQLQDKSQTDKTEETANIVDRKIEFIESVILLVKTETNGTILPTVLSTGRQRYGIKVHRRSFRQIRRSLSNKVMTRWRTQLNADSSYKMFLWANNTCIIFKSEPGLIFRGDALWKVKRGFIASLIHKFQNKFRLHSPDVLPNQIRIHGEAPNSDDLWSNIEIINGQPTMLTMDLTNSTIKRWFITSNNYSGYDWHNEDVKTLGIPPNPTALMFHFNSDNINLNNFLIRFSKKNSDGKSIFHVVDI